MKKLFYFILVSIIVYLIGRFCIPEFNRFYHSGYKQYKNHIACNNPIVEDSSKGSLKKYKHEKIFKTIVQRGHNTYVKNVIFSNDDRLFLSEAEGDVVKIWETQSGKLISSWIKPENIDLIGFTEEGKIIALGDNGWQFTLHGLTGKIIERCNVEYFSKSNNFLIHQTGRYVTTWQNITTKNKTLSKNQHLDKNNYEIKVWNISKKKLHKTFNILLSHHFTLEVSPSGNLICACWEQFENHHLKVFIYIDGNLVNHGTIDFDHDFGNIDFNLSEVKISPNGKFISFISSYDENEHHFDRNYKGKYVSTNSCYDPRHNCDANYIAVYECSKFTLWQLIDLDKIMSYGFFDTSGNFLICQDNAYSFDSRQIWCLNSKEIILKEDDYETGWISRSSRHLITSPALEGGMSVRYPGCRLSICDLKQQKKKDITDENFLCRSLAISAKGRYLAIIEEQFGRTIKVYDLQKMRLIFKLAGLPEDIVSHSEFDYCSEYEDCEFNKDGSRLMVQSTNGSVYIWETSNWTLLYSYLGIDAEVSYHQAINYRGDKVAIIEGYSHDVSIIDILTNKVEKRFTMSNDDAIRIISFSADGNFLAGVADNAISKYLGYPGPFKSTISVWDINKSKEILAINHHQRICHPLSFSMDGKHLLCGSKIYNTKDGTLKNNFGEFLLSTYSNVMNFKLSTSFLAIHPSSPYYITADDLINGDIQIRNKKDNSLIAKFYNLEDGLAIVTPNGYFNGSGDFENSVHFLYGDKIYNFNQFYDVFYRPDIVRMQIFNDQAAELSNKISIQKALKKPPPEIEISPTSNTLIWKKDVFPVKLKITDSGGGIGEVRVYHNGKLIESDGIYRLVRDQTHKDKMGGRNYYKRRGVEGIRKTIRQGTHSYKIKHKEINSKIKREYDVKLINGLNVISASAFNADNTIMSALRSIKVNAKKEKKQPKIYLIAIGIDNFKDSSFDLSLARKDASDLKKLFDSSACDLGGKGVHILLENADKNLITNAFDNFSNFINKEDIFILYIASHGTVINNLLYLLTTDYNGNIDQKNSISSIELMELAKQIPALKQVYILDCCYSGGMKSILLDLYNSRIAVISRSLGMHILAAAKSTQNTFEGYQNNGMFTHFILKGLSGSADINQDKLIMVKELSPYLKKEIITITQGKQEAYIYNFGDDFPITSIIPQSKLLN